LPFVGDRDGDIGRVQTVPVANDPGDSGGDLAAILGQPEKRQGDMVDAVHIIDEAVQHRFGEVGDSRKEPVEPGFRRKVFVLLPEDFSVGGQQGPDDGVRAVT